MSDIGELIARLELSHFSPTPIAEVVSVPIERQSVAPKPAGFWVSVDGEDDWRSWCEAEKFGDIDTAIRHRVTLSDAANILWLRCATDIDAFHSDYCGTLFPDSPYPIDYIRWQDVAQQYDGIIIAPYVWSRRLDDRARWYYGWDCASGCIWNAAAISGLALLRALPEKDGR